MNGDLVSQTRANVDEHTRRTGVRASRSMVRRVKRELEETVVAQARIERAKQIAVAGILAEDQLRNLADALHGDNATARLDADDYIRAVHGVGVNLVLEAGR